VFYAQPVAIKPVGHPIPAVPVRNPHAYKQPFPGQNGPGFNNGPGGPGFNVGPGFNPGPGFGQGSSGPSYNPSYPRPGGYPNFSKRPPPINGGIYGPPKPVPFENDFGYKKTQHKELVGGVNGPVQHVHHHYHHGGPEGAGGIHGGGIGGGIGGGSPIGVYPGFSKAPPAPVYEPDLEIDDQSGFGSNSEYGAPFYKKELNLNKKQLTGSAATNLNSYAGQYQGYESPRADNCYCVPAEQCPAHEVIGRKEDNTGYLIDPRNVATGIEADEAIIVAESEGSELVKREDANAKNTTESTNSTITTDAPRTKREAGDAISKDSKAQPVSIFFVYVNVNPHEETFQISFL